MSQFSIKCRNEIEVVTLDKEQEVEIKHIRQEIKEKMTRDKIKWERVTYFSSMHDLLMAYKVVTLNGIPLKEGPSIINPRAKKIALYHSVFKMTDGTFAVSSGTLNKYIMSKKSVIFRDDQIDCFGITKYLD